MNPFLAVGSIEIGGLPLHPLIVHFVVVLTPLTALALVVGSIWPAARRRLGVVTPLAALVVLVLVPVTVAAGDALKGMVGPLPAVLTHEALGRMLLPWAIAMFVVALAQWAWFRFGRPRLDEGRATQRRLIDVTLAIFAIAASAGATIMVVLIGDSGARAVWGGLVG